MVKKRNVLVMGWIMVMTLSLCSCLSLLNAVSTGSTSTGWSMGQFINEWGDKTGKYFIKYNDNVRGTFSNNVAQNAVMSARNIIFSEEEGLTFDLHDHDNDDSYFVFVSQINVIIKIGATEEAFEANKAGIRTVQIDFSNRLLQIFQREENMLFRVTTSSVNGALPSYYQFQLSPRSFNKAYENIQNMGSE